MRRPGLTIRRTTPPSVVFVAAAVLVLFALGAVLLVVKPSGLKAPSGLAASPADGAAILSWQHSDDVQDFEVQWRAAGERQWSTRTIRGDSHALVGLHNRIAYDIRIRARDGSRGGSPFSPIIRVRPRRHWMVTGENIRKIGQVDEELSRELFDNSETYALGNPDATQNQTPPGYRSVPTLVYRSYARFRTDTASGVIDPAIRALVYDPESWEDTPRTEQRDPALYFRLFSRLARRNGYEVVLAPGRDLTSVSRTCHRRMAETAASAFLRCNIAGSAARYADVLVIQGQADELDVTAYRRFVTRAAAQARSENPSVVVVAALTTSPGDNVASEGALADAARSVRGLIGGHWVTVLGRDPAQVETAAAFLRAVDAES